MQETCQDLVSETRELRLRVKERVEALRAESGEDPPPGLRENVRDVVVVASSSRGGSTMFAEILRFARGLLHFRAEINPFLRLSGLSYPFTRSGSDALAAIDLEDEDAARELDLQLSRDCGRPASRLTGEEDRDRFARDLAIRLTLQWPLLRFRREQVRGWLEESLEILRRDHGWRQGVFEDAQRFHAVFLSRVREEEPSVNPYYYDLRPSLIAGLCPGAPVPEGPPGPWVVEEPPFITISPWDPAGAGDLHSRPLIVKTPSNAYRLEALRVAFPRARIRVLHLTRNAAAAINGLYDGWCYPGFYSHRVLEPLEIPGYSDRFPAWGRSWWKFDLPPSWPEHRRKPILEVCAFQWMRAHEEVLEFCSRHPRVRYYRVPFEGVMDGPARRRETFEGLAGWLGISVNPELARVLEEGLPPIMATDQPRHRRWFARADLLDPILAQDGITCMMERLGYERDPTTWI